MAGSYPDAPDRKFAYDEDGTVVWWENAGRPSSWDAFEPQGISFLSTANKVKMNDTANSGNGSAVYVNADNGVQMCVYFPELRDVEGVLWQFINSGGPDYVYLHNIEYSTDTSNGIDGTWTATGETFDTRTGDLWMNPSFSGLSVGNAYRTQIRAYTWTGIRAFRFMWVTDQELIGVNHGISNLHVYGSIPQTQSPDRLLIMDNDTGLEFAMPQDWGDVPRGVTLDKEIFFRNNSSTLTANTITATFEDINPAPGGTSNTWHTIKEAGGSFGSSLTYTGSIAPGADSNTITIRLTVADDEDISLQEARMQVNVGSWT